MKKIYLILAVAALTFCAASCGNNTKKAEEAAPAEQTEAVAPEAEQTVGEAAQAAAEDVAKTAIEEAADAAKEAIKNN